MKNGHEDEGEKVSVVERISTERKQQQHAEKVFFQGYGGQQMEVEFQFQEKRQAKKENVCEKTTSSTSYWTWTRDKRVVSERLLGISGSMNNLWLFFSIKTFCFRPVSLPPSP